jgi:phosphoglycolate phosphatase-like HAD superfamily hydrolase
MPSKKRFFFYILNDETYGYFCRYGLDPKKTLMIGDRLNTDIEFGLNGGIDTLCVLTGNTKSAPLIFTGSIILIISNRCHY